MSKQDKERARRERYGLTQSKRSEMRGWLDRSIERQKGRCAYCERGMSRAGGLGSACYPSLDHIWCLFKGGPNVEENTVACCSRCNQLKGGLWLEEFLALLAEDEMPEVTDWSGAVRGKFYRKIEEVRDDAHL